MTREEFIKRAREIHGDKYDYSKVEYKNTKTKVCIICHEKGNNGNEHGEFWQLPFNHLYGQGCPECGKIIRNKIYDKEEFIKRAREVHGDKYDYSKVEYKDTRTKVCIIYPNHGEFWQAPNSHLAGHGWKENPKDKYLDFIKQAKEIHDNKYDYSKVNYINTTIKVCIICPEHGEFWQAPSAHLKGRGCPRCGGRGKLTRELFIEEAREIHGDKYDYSKVEYVNSATKVCIICPKHGEFWQTPSKHLTGQGCVKCGRITSSQKQIMSNDEFIEKTRKIHGNKYDYSKVDYHGYEEYVIIGCPEHGYFKQSPDSHLHSGGCPKCGATLSKNEDEIFEYISKLIGSENVEQRNRDILHNKEIDIYIPSLKIGFEYNGLYWHSTKNPRMNSNYHLDKMEMCNKKGVKLYQIFEDEYILKKEIVLSKIAHLLNANKNPKIMGRKCIIKEIDKKLAKDFLNNNHLQGFAGSSVYLGGFFDNKLISVMGFIKEKNNNKWELNRFASDINYNVIGIGGKMFKFFVKNYNPSEIKSFADRRWTQNEISNLYLKIGFKKEKYINPDYRYYNEDIDKYKRIHKFNFRKQILSKKYNFPLDMTENEMAEKLEYAKIWDCGLIKYVWKKK